MGDAGNRIVRLPLFFPCEYFDVTLLTLFANHRPPYHKELLRAAEKFRDDEHYGVSIITAHMACEIRAEQVINAALSLRTFDDAKEIADAVGAVAGGNFATNKRVLNLYKVLTKDAIDDQAFWKPFLKSRELRNAAVHCSKKNTHEDANTACEVAGQALKHLDSVMKRLHDEAKAKAVAAGNAKLGTWIR